MSEIEKPSQEEGNKDGESSSGETSPAQSAVKGDSEFGKHYVVVSKPLPLLSQQENVDLNCPPPNWLRQSGAGHYFQHSLLSQFDHTSSELHPSSINLASHYPRVVGEVDVIADAKNVKKLLMLPYSHSKVSMTIHRIGKTLIIDELTPAVQNSRLEELVSDNIELPNPARKKDPASSHHRNMYSKLLYYSIPDKPPLPMLPSSEPLEESSEPLEKSSEPSETLPDHSGMLPDPLPDSGSPDNNQLSAKQDDSLLAFVIREKQALQQKSKEVDTPQEKVVEKGAEGRSVEEVKDNFPCDPPDPPPQPFHLNVEWNIRDIRMLLGSDLPIFGKGGQPAVSLRLRDMQKPITVLTGLDYWLDNLMFNVPELAMCYHLNGIVQKYELIKTEDIPMLDKNSQFSPQEVLEVAQNILSFLNANCTHEGHTYWLFRPRGEEVVKLYDLTCLTVNEKDESVIQNPYAKSVAILFYRVSQRMIANGPQSMKDVSTVKVLLENCIKLIDNDQNSQMVISAYYLLADLVLNHTPSSATPTSSEEDESENSDGDNPPQESHIISNSKSQTFTVSRLRERQTRRGQSQPVEQPLVLETIQDKSKLALSYIANALIRFDPESILHEWQLKGLYQLLHKASLAYWFLSDSAMGLNKLGQALKYLKLTILSSKVAHGMSRKYQNETIDRQSIADVLHSAWQLCGDVHVFSTKMPSDSFAPHVEDFNCISPDDKKILGLITALYKLSTDEEDCLTLHNDIETSLKTSISCYKICEVALKEKGVSKDSSCQEKRKKLKERLGNALNELGVYYKQVASTLNFNTDSKEMEKYWSSSYDCLVNGIACFKETNNLSNQSLLHANLGSLMKLCAESHSSLTYENDEGERTQLEFNPKEKQYYNRSIEYYIKAKEILRRPATHQGIWLNIECDLAGVYYEMGKQMQERPPLSSLTLQEVERDILSHLMKGLHHAESASDPSLSTTSKSVTISQLIGDCHYRLASLYHKISFEDLLSNQKLKHSRAQSEKHYTKALQSYLIEHHHKQIIKVYLGKALLLEQLSNGSIGKAAVRLLHQSLENLLDTHIVLRKCSKDTKGPLIQLVVILIQRLRSVLKLLLSFALRKGEHVELYKSMYSSILKVDQSSLSNVIDTLSTVSDLFNNHLMK